jgi:hypothetical protein
MAANDGWGLLPTVRRDVLAPLFARPSQAFCQLEIVHATEGGGCYGDGISGNPLRMDKR